MFYEKDNFGFSAIVSIAHGLALGNIYGDEESKKVSTLSSRRLRRVGSNDVADVLLEIWEEKLLSVRHSVRNSVRTLVRHSAWLMPR